MSQLKNFSRIGALALVLGAASAQSAWADFVPFVIRNSSGNVAPAINLNTPAAGQTEFVITLGSQKAALGSNDINGSKVGQIANVSIDRLDDRTRFATNQGAYYAPYLNLWIKDSAGNYAVLANEPSNGEWNGIYNNGWSFGFDTLSTKIAKIFERETAAFLLPTATGPSGAFLFSDFAGYVIEAPSAAALGTGWTGLGGGAPRELGTNLAYGVNWVFGDTLSNYVADGLGYRVANASVSAVPEPGSAAMVLLGLLAAGAARRASRAA